MYRVLQYSELHPRIKGKIDPQKIAHPSFHYQAPKEHIPPRPRPHPPMDLIFKMSYSGELAPRPEWPRTRSQSINQSRPPPRFISTPSPPRKHSRAEQLPCAGRCLGRCPAAPAAPPWPPPPAPPPLAWPARRLQLTSRRRFAPRTRKPMPRRMSCKVSTCHTSWARLHSFAQASFSWLRARLARADGFLTHHAPQICSWATATGATGLQDSTGLHMHMQTL